MTRPEDIHEISTPSGTIAFHPDAAHGGFTRVRVFIGVHQPEALEPARALAGELTVRNDELAILRELTARAADFVRGEADG